MFDLNGILTALQTDPNARGKAMAGAGGLAAGLLMGKSGRKMLGKAAKYGAVAAIGGLAYKAWQDAQHGKPGATGAGQPHAPAPAGPDYEAAPAGTEFLPPPSDEAAQDLLGQSLVRAMIAAAKADGKIDAAEKQRIFDRLNAMDLSAEEKAFVFDELSAPLDIERVVSSAQSPEHAAELYAASLVAIEAETAAEQAYLQMLAARLEIDPAVVEEIHNTATA